MSLDKRKVAFEFFIMSDTNRPVQFQQKAQSLNFRIREGERLYYMYLRSENKGAAPLFLHRQNSSFMWLNYWKFANFMRT